MAVAVQTVSVRVPERRLVLSWTFTTEALSARTTRTCAGSDYGLAVTLTHRWRPEVEHTKDIRQSWNFGGGAHFGAGRRPSPAPAPR
jgi:hypothetical protein